MTAVFTFEIGWTSHRPVRPDEHTSRVTVAGEDSAAGLAEARALAAQMASGGRWGMEMVTSSRLVGAEL